MYLSLSLSLSLHYGCLEPIFPLGSRELELSQLCAIVLLETRFDRIDARDGREEMNLLQKWIR